VGREAEPAGGLATRSRAVRASCLPALRPACEVRRWKWSDRRRSDPRPLDGVPTKPGPDRTKGPHTPWEEPWWDAGRRALPSRSGDGAAPQGAEGPLRLPAFHFPSFSEAKKPTGTTRPPPLLRSVCSRFALHVAEIRGPQAKARAGTGNPVRHPEVPAVRRASKDAAPPGPSPFEARCARTSG
jgi:hypothetical protein